jgi:VWFA-related protein
MFSNVASVGRESLKRISGETGGRYFESTELKELEKSTQEMSGQYLMEYQSTNSKADKKFRKIRVESVNKNYKVRHREGYWSP